MKPIYRIISTNEKSGLQHMNNNSYVLSLLFQAETLYNNFITNITDLSYSDKLLKSTRTSYYITLLELRTLGIGGVIINGSFKDICN